MAKKVTRKADPTPEPAPEPPPEITRDKDYDYYDLIGQSWMSRKGSERTPAEHVAFSAFGEVYRKAIDTFISGTDEEMDEAQAVLDSVAPRYLRRIMRNVATGEPPTDEEIPKLLIAGAAEKIAKLLRDGGGESPDPTSGNNS